MDKRVIFAVAGSGKTTYIVEQLDDSQSSLLITFTNNNFENLRRKVIMKFGYLPTNIKIYTYFTFLHSFCYKPYLLLQYRTKGINYKYRPNRYARGKQRYIDKHQRLYYYRIAKFLKENNILNDVNRRIEKYFNNLFIDEIQDFAGNDFNFLKNISKVNLNVLYVGDFYQHTFDTSRDANVNAPLHKDYQQYQIKFKNMGFNVDLDSLNKSYRCTASVCEFISQKIGIEIYSHRTTDTNVVYVANSQDAKRITSSNDIVKLFYQEHHKYDCCSMNWGESKGIDNFNDVCVVLNKNTEKYFNSNKLNELSPMVKNKLYVACSRTRKNLYILPYSIFYE